MSADQVNATAVTPQEHFSKMKSGISEVPDNKRVNVTLPYVEFMQEGHRVTTLVEKYGDKLRASDIDPQLLDTMADRSGAFAYCVASLESSIAVNETNSTRYNELKKEGYALRRKLIADFEYVFRTSDEIKAMLGKIRQGRGDLEMFKDLLSLHKVAVDHKKRLTDAHFDFALAEKAYTLYNDLINLSAAIDIDPEKITDEKQLVQKAAVVLWEAMEEIYAAGRYVFYDQPEIEELFYIDYFQKAGKRREKKATEPQPEEPETVEPEPADATAS